MKEDWGTLVDVASVGSSFLRLHALKMYYLYTQDWETFGERKKVLWSN